MQAADAPSSEESALTERRFRFAGRGHPAVEAMVELANAWMPEEPGGLTELGALPPQDLTPAGVDPVDIVQMEIRLPPLPAVLLELQEVIQRRNSSASQVAEVIAKDPGLAAWLLRLVNSPYYGFAAKISTISRAVSLVGTRQIQTLALGGALNSLAVLMPKGLIDMERFWRHSLATAVAAREIWSLSGRHEAEQLFVAGLLHDCGKLAMVYAAPKTVARMQSSPVFREEPSYQAEQKLLGFDHARLGGMLLHRWNMPLALIMAVLRHHTVEDPLRYPEAAATHIAEVFTAALGISGSPADLVPPLSPQAWDVMGLPVQRLNTVAEALRAKLDLLCSSMNV